MSQTTLETQQEFIQKRKLHKKRPRKGIIVLKILLLLLSISLWGSLLYGGYWLANKYISESKQYINTKVAQIETKNQEQMQTFKDLQEDLDKIYTELKNVKGQLQYIQEDLTLTGETINGTDKTKQALQHRIDELNIQLVDLQDSIKKLEDAAK